jgi:hypothetical protein
VRGHKRMNGDPIGEKISAEGASSEPEQALAQHGAERGGQHDGAGTGGWGRRRRRWRARHVERQQEPKSSALSARAPMLGTGAAQNRRSTVAMSEVWSKASLAAEPLPEDRGGMISLQSSVVSSRSLSEAVPRSSLSGAFSLAGSL